MKLRDKVVLTTFGLFMFEAIIHYNTGKNDCDKTQKKSFLPPTKTLIKLGLVVGAFSVINGVIIKNLES
jgi:formate hydrogenlyase subunit 3/multisubunit Na+/H+ antiporter MnhD subunit